MKHFALIITLAALICSCTNPNSVNVIVTNTQQQDIKNVRVEVALAEISSILGSDVTTPIVLNEQNTFVPYSYNKNRDSITFYMPIIHKGSQKTYSVNKGMPKMNKNFLRSEESIRISK